MSECTEERFFGDIENHTMEILRDDGTDRHISFTDNGSSIYRFDLITWPGHLCITGDCGTYVFSRVTDMFEFFRTDDKWKKPEHKLFINTGYWGEKLLSIGTNAGYKEFSPELFEENLRSAFDQWGFDKEKATKEWERIQEHVLDYAHDGEHGAITAAMEFATEDDTRLFDDFYEHDCKAFTFHYLWCLYAISHGVAEYDRRKDKTN